MRHILYSANTYFKLHIAQTYCNDLHYIWCSEYYDARTLALYNPARNIPASSNPCQILQELKRDVETRDKHSAKINSQKSSFLALALQWHQAGKITDTERDEITYLVNTADFDMWRPLLYVIPSQPIQARLQLVPMAGRAGFGKEYIISDLARGEFDVVEF